MSIPRRSAEDSDSQHHRPTRRFTRQDSQAVYSLAQQSTPLGLKVKHALEVVEKAIQLYSIDHLALSFNGGKDCTVLVHLLAASLIHLSSASSPTPVDLPSIPTIYVRQPSPFPQEEKFTLICSTRYNLDLQAVQGETMKDSLRIWMEGRKKEKGKEVKAVLVGTRRTDPHGAKLTSFDPTDPTWPRFIRVHPILDWSYSEIWQFLKHPDLTLGASTRGSEPVGGGVEWCELYDYGYTSIGSTHNTFPNPLLRRTPSTTPFSSNPSTPTLDPTTTTISGSIEAIGSWLPAWELRDETQERAGREVSLNQVEQKVGQLRDQVSRDRERERERSTSWDEEGRENGENGK
ncbi:hypothetical protein JCM16303_000064 [Sporobolomyces ruberrimus]